MSPTYPRSLIVAVMFAVACSLEGQQGGQVINPIQQIQWPLTTGNGAPTTTCQPNSPPPANAAAYGQQYIDMTNQVVYNCMAPGTWKIAPVLPQFGNGAPPPTCSVTANNGAIYNDKTANTIYICDGSASTWRGPFAGTGPVGPPGPPIAWTGDWKNTTAYTPFQGATYNGNGFAALIANTNVTPPPTCITNTTWSCVAAGAIALPLGAVGNGTSAAKSMNYAASSLLSNGQSACSPMVYVPFGNSTVAQDTTFGQTFQVAAANPFSPLNGMCFVSIVGAYSCNTTSSVTFTAANANPAGTLYLTVGDDFSPVSNSNGSNLTGPLFFLTLYSQNAAIFNVTAAGPTSITATANQAVCSAAGSGNITGQANITPNIVKQGYGGTGYTFNGGFLMQNLLTKTIPLLQYEATTLGRQPLLMLREGLINDVRSDLTNFPTALNSIQTALKSVTSAQGLSNIPILFVGEESLTSSTSGGTYTCAAGSPIGGNCSASAFPMTLGAGTTGGTPTTVLLINPTDVPARAVPSIWPGPGMPQVVSSQGNNMQVTINGGGGSQEVVTVTGVNCTVTGLNAYTCSITFTPANSHAAGESVVATRAWAAQVFTDELWNVLQTVKTWVNPPAPGTAAPYFPTLQTFDTQGALYGRYASTGQPTTMADNLHLSSWVAEDNAIVQIIAPSTASPAAIAPMLPYAGLLTGGTTQPSLNVGLDYPQRPCNSSIDPAFSEYAAQNSRNQNGFWSPWTANNNTRQGASAYPLSAADCNYFDTVAIGSLASAYNVGGTSITLQSQSSGLNNNLFAGSGANATLGDIIYIPGLGAYAGQIASVATNGANSQWIVTLVGSPSLPAIPSGTVIVFLRYKELNPESIAYDRAPESYPYRDRGFITGGGTSTYQVNIQQASNQLKRGPFSSITGGYVLNFAGGILTGLSLDYANLGNGAAVNGDTVTYPCDGTPATGTLSVQNGIPYAVTMTGLGANCYGSSVISVAVTDTTTPGATGIKLFSTGGRLTLPTVAGAVRSTQIGTGTPSGYATNDTITLGGCTTAATWTAQGVTGGVPTYLKPVQVGVGCAAGSNLATTTSGSGTGLTVTVAVTAATSCTRTTAQAFRTCTDGSGTNYALFNNIAFDARATAWPDSYGSNGVFNSLELTNPTVNNLGTNVTGCSGGASECQAFLQDGSMSTGLQFVTTLLPADTGTPTFTATAPASTPTCVGTCTNRRGKISIVANTAGTGPIGTLNFSGTLRAPPDCTVTEAGGTSSHGLDVSGVTASLFNITAAVSVSGATVLLHYVCLR